MRSKLAKWAGATTLALWATACASTETGNPPVIRESAVQWYALEGVVVFEGEPDAVAPGGSTIEVRNQLTRKVTRMRSQRDGSFKLRAPGTSSDGFTMSAENGGQRSEPFPVIEPVEDAGPPSDATLAMCEDQTVRAASAVEDAIAGADRNCEEHEDCVALRPSAETSCFLSCTREFGSKAGRRALEAAVASAEADICAGFSQARCPRQTSDCPPEPAENVPLCKLGVCTSGIYRGEPTDCGGAIVRSDRELATALETAAQGCSTAADCTFVSTTTQCKQACKTEPILRASEQSFAQTVQRIDAEICAPVRPNCSRVVEGCAAPPEIAACTDGRCVRAP